jgi:exodeoxyribonuclease V alpha subunit
MSDRSAPHDADAIAARALAHLRAEGGLRTIDGAFADLLRQRFGAGACVALAGALAMRAIAFGHSGFALERAEALLDALDLRTTLPSTEDWRARLQASALVGDATRRSETAATAMSEPRSVLLYFEHGRVSLRRYAVYEQRLADALRQRCASAAANVAAPVDAHAHDPAIATILKRLFEPERDVPDGIAGDAEALDRQAFAAWRSLHRRLLLITGGPGTGKTTTVARLLALQLAAAELHGEPPPRIALAAPTGRAAARLAEAIATSCAQDLASGRIDPTLAARIPVAAHTLHRLLGSRPGHVGFRHHAAHPLPFDLVVVDEASMIDLPLMTKLTDAIAPQARLVLLGDPDQLPAVEAGDVLGGLCAAAGDELALSAREREAARVAFAEDAIGEASPARSSDPSAEQHAPLAGHRVHLLRGWRQIGARALQALTDAVREGDEATVFARLSADDPALCWRHGEPTALSAWLREHVLPSFLALRDADDPAGALRLARRMRVLTALRRGPFGAEFWNAWCAIELGAREVQFYGAQYRDSQFHGRLIAIAENSPRHGLYNGDLGVLWRDRDDDSDLTAWFESGGRTRAWRPGQLPAHTTAFATTVHKAQGSEFEAIALLLPQAETRALSRELLYTALTRAQQRVLLWAAPPTLRRALRHRTLRDSGLLSRLRATETDRQQP